MISRVNPSSVNEFFVVVNELVSNIVGEDNVNVESARHALYDTFSLCLNSFTKIKHKWSIILSGNKE